MDEQNGNISGSDALQPACFTKRSRLVLRELGACFVAQSQEGMEIGVGRNGSAFHASVTGNFFRFTFDERLIAKFLGEPFPEPFGKPCNHIYAELPTQNQKLSF